MTSLNRKRPVSSLADQNRAPHIRRETSHIFDYSNYSIFRQPSQLEANLVAASTNTLDDAYNDFRLSRKAMQLKPTSIRFYDQRWRAARSIILQMGIKVIKDITPRHLRKLQIELANQGLSQHTVHGTMRFLKAFMNFAEDEGLIDESPMKRVRMPRLDRRILPAYTPPDIDDLVRECDNARDRAILVTLLDTGLRVSELVSLDIRDIDFTTNKIKVRQGKGGKGRTVFFGRGTAKALKEYLRERGDISPDDHLCASLTSGRRITDNGIRQVLRRLGRRANVKDCSPHIFRRTFALMSLKQGMDLHTLARIMGHSDISVLRHYLPFVDDDLREAHRLFGPVDNLLTSVEKEVSL